MNVLIINGFRWYYEKSSGYFYENEDKTGGKIHQSNKHFTSSERLQIMNQLRYSNPMINT